MYRHGIGFVFTSKFTFGQKVRVDGGDIEGVVTSFSVQGEAESISVEVAWFHNGDVKTGWFREYRLETVT